MVKIIMKKKVVALATVAMLSASYAGNAAASTYVVQKGDTLSHIARKYNTRVADIKEWNRLTSDLIHINQTLIVSKQEQKASTPSAPPAPVQAASTYIVVSGDTLIKIANKHNITLPELKEWNGLKDHLIYPGQKLNVSRPGQQSGTGSAQPAPAPAPPPPAQSPANPAPAAPTAEYIVKSGDTLSHIGTRFGLSVQQLKAMNNLSSDMIYVGQKLKVSGKPEEKAAPGSQDLSAEVSVLLEEAKKHLGTPYVWGGSSTSGFDCSGFIYYVYNKAGKSINRLSSEGYFNRSYYVTDPQPGDLVFFENTYKKGISHMGIYLGNNQFIHADDSGVRVTSLDDSYYKKHFDSFKRFY